MRTRRFTSASSPRCWATSSVPWSRSRRIRRSWPHGRTGRAADTGAADFAAGARVVYIRRVRPASTTDPVDAVSPVPEKGVRSRGRPRVRHIWIVSSISHSRKDSHGSHLGTCRPHTDHTHHRGLRTHGQRERILPRRPPHLHLGELHTGAPRSR